MVRSAVAPVRLGESFIDRLVRGIFPFERKIVPYNIESLFIPAINYLSAEIKYNDNKEQGAMTRKEEHAPGLVRLRVQTNIPPRSKRLCKLRQEKALLRKSLLLEQDGTLVWTTVKAIDDTFLYLALSVIFLDSTSTHVCLQSTFKNLQVHFLIRASCTVNMMSLLRTS